MTSSSHRWALVAFATAGALLACNQILGVEDVRLAVGGSRLDGGGTGTSGGTGGDDDDATVVPNHDADVTPEEPHPTLALGYDHTCARMLDSTVRCWGSNFSGQLGDSSSRDASAPDPQPALRPKMIPGINDAIAIASGFDHTCIVRKTGKVFCWGSGYVGQLGTNTEEPSSIPTEVKGITDAIGVGAGSLTTCAIHKDTTASCWGSNSQGGLGDGTTAESDVPVKVNLLKDIVQIAPSQNHTCAVVANGDLWCWGGADDGQLGTGSLVATTTPVKITALSDIAQVATASRFSCARTKKGAVYCWGRNESGQLGNGAPTSAPNPSPIAVPLTDAAFIWVGSNHACAVRKTGEIACWGDGAQGQLGLGAFDASTGANTPTALPGIKNARAVYTGGLHSCLIAADNKAMCWGDNASGQLGIGSIDDKGTPTAVSDFP